MFLNRQFSGKLYIRTYIHTHIVSTYGKIIVSSIVLCWEKGKKNYMSKPHLKSSLKVLHIVHFLTLTDSNVGPRPIVRIT